MSLEFEAVETVAGPPPGKTDFSGLNPSSFAPFFVNLSKSLAPLGLTSSVCEMEMIRARGVYRGTCLEEGLAHGESKHSECVGVYGHVRGHTCPNWRMWP